MRLALALALVLAACGGGSAKPEPPRWKQQPDGAWKVLFDTGRGVNEL